VRGGEGAWRRGIILIPQFGEVGRGEAWRDRDDHSPDGAFIFLIPGPAALAIIITNPSRHLHHEPMGRFSKHGLDDYSPDAGLPEHAKADDHGVAVVVGAEHLGLVGGIDGVAAPADIDASGGDGAVASDPRPVHGEGIARAVGEPGDHGEFVVEKLVLPVQAKVGGDSGLTHVGGVGGLQADA